MAGLSIPGMDALPAGYGSLLDAAVRVLEVDHRVRGAWVHGSVARQEADEVSDLDVIVAVADDHLPVFGAEWRERLHAITPTVMARPTFGFGGSWLSITPECLRFDMWVEPTSAVATSLVHDRVLLFDRDGLDHLVPAPPAPPGPSEAKLATLRAWAGDCASVAASAGGLLAIECTHTLRWILYEAYVETNRPVPATGLKRWSSRLTTDQRRQFEQLPTGGDGAPVVEAIEAVLGPLPRPDQADLARAVFPPEGLIRGLALPAVAESDRGRHLAEEFFALHLYLGVVVHREDWLLGVEGVHSLRRLLYELFLENNGRPPQDGPASWDARLTAEQRDVLLGLPTGEATKTGVISGHLAVRDAFVRHGRELVPDMWPVELERAVTAFVDSIT